MRRVSLLTLFVFLISISTGLGVYAGDRHENRHDDDKHKYKIYKHKYKKYKKKYYHMKKKMDRDKHSMKKLWKGIKHLDLSDDQKNRLHELKYDWKLEKIDLKSAIEKQKVRLHRHKKSDRTDRQALQDRIDALYDAKAEYKKALYTFKFDVKDVLTEQQMDKLKSMKKKDHETDKRKDKKHGDKQKDDDDGEGSYF